MYEVIKMIKRITKCPACSNKLQVVTLKCKNCGFIVSAIDSDFDRAEKAVIEKWCLWLKTKDYPVWTRGKKDAKSI